MTKKPHQKVQSIQYQRTKTPKICNNTVLRDKSNKPIAEEWQESSLTESSQQLQNSAHGDRNTHKNKPDRERHKLGVTGSTKRTGHGVCHISSKSSAALFVMM